MDALTRRQKEVLICFRESMNHNHLGGVRASDASGNIDMPLHEVRPVAAT